MRPTSVQLKLIRNRIRAGRSSLHCDVGLRELSESGQNRTSSQSAMNVPDRRRKAVST